MLETRLDEEELLFMETLHYPPAAAECLFSDIEGRNFAEFNQRFSHIRLYQYLFLSFEYLIDEDLSLTSKENFSLREQVGTVYALCGRLIGKTIVVEQIDLFLSMLLSRGVEYVGLTSLDLLHIRGVIEDVIRGLEYHPIFRMLEPKITRSPNYRISLRNGYLLESVNQNLASKNPGNSFYQKHFTRLYIEEASFETEEIYKKRIESVSEKGCIVRAGGMTNFTKYSPVGRVFGALEYKYAVVNIPQFINPMWDEKLKRKAIEKHGGQETASYRIYVLGQVVEEGLSVIDMDRVRPHYLENKTIKHFEVTKENFDHFESFLILDRMRNASQVWITADIGEAAPTEITIFFEIVTGEFSKYRYTYNITAYNLTEKQQFKLFRWLAEKLKANYIALDTTEGTGRAIFRSLEEVIPKENLVWVGFNEKLNVGFETDEQGKVLIDQKGNPIYREEFVAEWSIQHLKDLLYSGRIQNPIDYKLDTQLNSLVATKSGNRIVYGTVCEEDHLLAAFRCFSIAQWKEEFSKSRPIQTKKAFKGRGVWISNIGAQ